MQQQHPDFDSIKQTSPYGAEFWSARDLMPLLGYDRWECFEGAIKRAMKACNQVGQPVEDHFWRINKTVQIGYGASREIINFNLTRYAFHLLIALSDIRKPEIAQALAYFTFASLEQNFDYSAASKV